MFRWCVGLFAPVFLSVSAAWACDDPPCGPPRVILVYLEDTADSNKNIGDAAIASKNEFLLIKIPGEGEGGTIEILDQNRNILSKIEGKKASVFGEIADMLQKNK